MYTVTYYVNRQPFTYGFKFNSEWAAKVMASRIFHGCGLATDVMHEGTGEIVAIFEPGNIQWDC